MQTISNLAAAFVGESQARNRYTFYAKIAKKEGYEAIAALFALTAEQEQEHAKWLFRLLQELKADQEKLSVPAEVPLTLGTTLENLEAAIAGEKYEHTEMYPAFADIAEKEGYAAVARRLRAIAVAEKNHQERYQRFQQQLKEGSIFRKPEEIEWVCRKCGYVHRGTTPPEACPACDHPQGYYEPRQ